MSKVIKAIKIGDEVCSLVDSVSRERLDNVEYQTIETEGKYEHKELPEGKKTVTTCGDGVWGDVAFVVEGGDIIPRKTFNRAFPYNGISIARNGKICHIEGVATAASGVAFSAESGISYIELSEDIAGKNFSLVSCANSLIGKTLSAKVQFYKDNNGTKVTVPVLDSSGASKNSISAYVANTALTRVTNFSVPENVDITHMQVMLTFTADATFDHDVQVYLVETNNIHDVTLENPTATINNETITSLLSFPYKSTVLTNTPIQSYIEHMTRNAKGDTATYLTPEAFGAIGDGYADDTSAIKSCLDAAITTNQTVIMAKKYLITTPLDITHTGLDVIANEIIYNGDDAAIKISGQKNTFKIHSITSNAIGITFRADNDIQVMYNVIDINSLITKSHGIVFYNGILGICQNNIRFSFIQAGGSECYGICELNIEGDSWITENNFYGGHIRNCEWAVYGISRNSKIYGVQIENNVRGCFYIVGQGLQIFHPRLAESQKDGDLPAYKFVDSQNVNIYDSTGIYLNQIDLSEGLDTFENDAGQTIPIQEYKFGIINGKIIGRNFELTVGSPVPSVYTTKAYVWGKYLIMTPHMAYRKVVTTTELDTRNIGKETAQEEVKVLSQLPTKFVVDSINSDIYLHESYCAFGFNEFEVEQSKGFTCKVYDKLNNLIFDGTDLGDGLYRFKVYKDADKSVRHGAGLLRRDFLGHYWEVIKSTDIII